MPFLLLYGSATRHGRRRRLSPRWRGATHDALESLLGGVFLGLGNDVEQPFRQQMHEQAARAPGPPGEHVLGQCHERESLGLGPADAPRRDRLPIERQHPGGVPEIRHRDVPQRRRQGPRRLRWRWPGRR